VDYVWVFYDCVCYVALRCSNFYVLILVGAVYFRLRHLKYKHIMKFVHLKEKCRNGRTIWKEDCEWTVKMQKELFPAEFQQAYPLTFYNKTIQAEMIY
jgi:hypothetical protein